jgi:ubiquinone/menaquinone biosynthesis C-methylase UbiE
MRPGITHASVRQGDIFNLPLERESFDVVTIHQVLHFLHDPLPAITEAARMLAPAAGDAWWISPPRP